MFRRAATAPTARATAAAPPGVSLLGARGVLSTAASNAARARGGALPILLALAVLIATGLMVGLRTPEPPAVNRMQQMPSAPPPTLRVAVFHMWLGAGAVMAELDILSRVTLLALGRPLEPVDELDSADVILFGPYGDRARSGAVARNYSARAITVFIGCENTPAYADSMVGDVDISLGHARHIVAPTYLRMPWWLPYCLDGAAPSGAPRFSPLLRRPVDPTAWRARARPAALLSRHYAFPRRQLFELLMAAGVRVEAPGKAFHNAEWPAELPNSHLRGKVEYLESTRFNVCPESAKTGVGGGYTTEKLAQALMSGTVPIYWGDDIDVDVFEPRRVILYDGSNNASVRATILRLEEDDKFRASWFSVPALVPGADA